MEFYGQEIRGGFSRILTDFVTKWVFHTFSVPDLGMAQRVQLPVGRDSGHRAVRSNPVAMPKEISTNR
jgi:hypothetical protein